MSKRLKILTWHVHGSYLYYLSRIHHDIYLPIDPKKDGYLGKTTSYPWPNNIYEILAEDVKYQKFDCILYQSVANYLEDRWHLLSADQRNLPQIYLEHDPPRLHPTDTRHPVDDSNVLIVHVSHFNRLMWDCANTPTKVIEHGVEVPSDIQYLGNLDKGIVVINNIFKRGRRLGYDLFEQARKKVALDLVGMGWEEVGGIGEISHNRLPNFISNYRFFYNPIRYTSLGLAICEAMMVGLPIVGMATTELATVIENNISGIINTNHDVLIEAMLELQKNKNLAMKLSRGAREVAKKRFTIERFVRDWEQTLSEVTIPYSYHLPPDLNHISSLSLEANV